MDFSILLTDLLFCYVVISGWKFPSCSAADKGFLSKVFGTQNSEPQPIPKKQEVLDFDLDDDSAQAPKIIVKNLDQTINLDPDQKIHLDSDSDKEDDFVEEHLIEPDPPPPPIKVTSLTPEEEALLMPKKRRKKRKVNIRDDDSTLIPESETAMIGGVQVQTAREPEDELLYSDEEDEMETPEAEAALMPLKTKVKRDADADDDDSVPVPVVLAPKSVTIPLGPDSDEEDEIEVEDSNVQELAGGLQPQTIPLPETQPLPIPQAQSQTQSHTIPLPETQPQTFPLPETQPQTFPLPETLPLPQSFTQQQPRPRSRSQAQSLPQTLPRMVEDSMDIPLEDGEDVSVISEPEPSLPLEPEEEEFDVDDQLQEQQEYQQQELQEELLEEQQVQEQVHVEQQEVVSEPSKSTISIPIKLDEEDPFSFDDEGETINLDFDSEDVIEQEAQSETVQGSEQVSGTEEKPELEKKPSTDTDTKSETEDEPSSDLESFSEAEDISYSETESKTDTEKKTVTKKKKRSLFSWRRKSKDKEEKKPVKQSEAKPTPVTETKPEQVTETKTEPEKKPEPEPEPKPPAKPIADLKLYALDPNTQSYVELDESKYELMEELGEVNYALKNLVHCHLITYCDVKVWSAGDNGVDDPESISCDPINGQITVNSVRKGVMYREDGSGNWQYVSSFNYTPDYREILRPEFSAEELDALRATISLPQGKSQQTQGPTTGVPAILQALNTEAFQLYTDGEQDTSHEMNQRDYRVTREGYETDFEFKPDKKCTEIKFDKMSIWKKGDFDIKIPTSISYNQQAAQVTIRDKEKEVTYQRDLLGTWKYQSTARYDSEFTPFGLTSAILGSPDYTTDFSALFRQQPTLPPTIQRGIHGALPAGPPILKSIRADPFQLFTDGEQEESYEMDHRDYQVTREGYETDYEFKPDKKCTEIKFDNKSIWKKGDHNINVPTSVSYNDDRTQVTIRDGEKAIILVRDQAGDWYCRTAAKYHYDFDSAYKFSHHDEDYSLKAKMKTVLTVVDIKNDKQSKVEYDFKEDKKKKISTYTTKPGYQLRAIKYDGHTIWHTDHREGFCTEVIFNNISNKVRSVVLKMDNGSQKEFQYANKRWIEFLAPQQVPAGTKVRDEYAQILDHSKRSSQTLESEAESGSDIEIEDAGSPIDLSGSDIELTDTEEVETGCTIELPPTSPGIIVQLPPLGSGTTAELPESKPEVSLPDLTSLFTASAGITVPLPQPKVESVPESIGTTDNTTGMLHSDTESLFGKETPVNDVTMDFPQSDVESIIELPHSDTESLFAVPASLFGGAMDYPQSDVESIVEMAHSDTESLFEMPKPGSTITRERPKPDAKSPAGEQMGSMILDPNMVHTKLCMKLKAQRVDSNVDKGIICFKTKFVDMTIWSRRYGRQNKNIPIMSRSLYALFFNGTTWTSQ